jgi:hypothetical protein
MTITYQHRIYVVQTEADLARFLAWVRHVEAA